MARSSQVSVEAGTSFLPKNFTLMDAKTAVNLIDSDLQGLEEAFQHHASLFWRCTKTNAQLFPRLSVYLRSLDILGKATGKKSQARGAD